MSEESPICYVNVDIKYGAKAVPDVNVALRSEETDELFQATTDENGHCVIKIYNPSPYKIFKCTECGEIYKSVYDLANCTINNHENSLVEFNGEYTKATLIQEDIEDLFTDYIIEIDCEQYGCNLNKYSVTSKNNELLLYLVKIDECQNEVLTRKECKYFLHEPYMTPNNFDIYFNESDIPTNVIKESSHNLLKRLQKTMPLTDIVHLNLQTEQNPNKNVVNIHTKMNLNYFSKELLLEGNLQIKGTWKEIPDENKGTVNISFLYDENQENLSVPIEAEVLVYNKNYPYSSFNYETNDGGVLVLSQIPYGTYIIQARSNRPDNEENIGATFEIVCDTETSNESITLEEVENYDWWGDEGFDVQVIGLNNEVVDTVKFQDYTNLSEKTISLPFYNPENASELINYTLSYEIEGCDLEIESVELEENKKNEVMLL